MKDEIRAYIDAAATTAATKARQEFELVVERLETKIDLTVESVRLLDQKVDRLRDDVQVGFREVSARIDVSVAQLTDRYSALEQRVERLEAIVAQLSH